jgi:Zn finger protein HypA/HybF involved in hydrogenase expression
VYLSTTLASFACLALVATTLGYAAVCVALPFGRCRRCRGTGRRYSSLSRRLYRYCPRCDGTGLRVRLGRRVWEYLRAERNRGSM